MGELHLEVLQNRLAQEYDLNVTLGRMLVAYRETVTAQAPGKVRHPLPSSSMSLAPW